MQYTNLTQVHVFSPRKTVTSDHVQLGGNPWYSGTCCPSASRRDSSSAITPPRTTVTNPESDCGDPTVNTSHVVAILYIPYITPPGPRCTCAAVESILRVVKCAPRWRVDAMSRFGDRGYLETNRAAGSNCCDRLQQLISGDQLYVNARSGHGVAFFENSLSSGLRHPPS